MSPYRFSILYQSGKLLSWPWPFSANQFDINYTTTSPMISPQTVQRKATLARVQPICQSKVNFNFTYALIAYSFKAYNFDSRGTTSSWDDFEWNRCLAALWDYHGSYTLLCANCCLGSCNFVDHQSIKRWLLQCVDRPLKSMIPRSKYGYIMCLLSSKLALPPSFINLHLNNPNPTTHPSPKLRLADWTTSFMRLD
jgi:hypothetical protein